MYMSMYALCISFRTDVLGQVHYGGQDGNAARIQDETDHSQ